MNATELYLKDGTPTGVFFCGKCRTAWGGWVFDGDEFHESIDELLESLDAIEKFNTANAKVCSYSPDYSKAVLIGGER